MADDIISEVCHVWLPADQIARSRIAGDVTKELIVWIVLGGAQAMNRSAFAFDIWGLARVNKLEVKLIDDIGEQWLTELGRISLRGRHISGEN